ncbi:hypothetical protein C8R43DRAFT_1125414 [Mycena crocata]|nr:hypothetical protein C8R43DRAFT_1125414 [Mycena crocata]
MIPKGPVSDVLDSFVKQSVTEVEAAGDVTCQHLNEFNADSVTVQVTGEKRKIWRLGPLNEDGHVEHELVFRIQGILSQCSLTPGDVNRRPESHVAHMSQKVGLVGAGSVKFQQGVDNMKRILSLFTRHFQNPTDARWAATNDNADGIVSASNRFLTSTEEEPGAVHIDFGPGVDPMDRLKSFVGPGLVHTVDNVVSYFKQSTNEATSKKTYGRAVPSTFRIGDVVEIQVSVMAFESANKSVKLHWNLRALTLLDATFSKAAEDEYVKEIKTTFPKTVTLKRKIGYEGAEIEDRPQRKETRGDKSV